MFIDVPELTVAQWNRIHRRKVQEQKTRVRELRIGNMNLLRGKRRKP